MGRLVQPQVFAAHLSADHHIDVLEERDEEDV